MSRIYITKAPGLYPRTPRLSYCVPHLWALQAGGCGGQNQLAQGVSFCHTSAQPGKAAVGAFPIIRAQATPRGFHSCSQLWCPQGLLCTPEGRGHLKAAVDSDSVPAAALVPAILNPALDAQTWWPEGRLEVSVQLRTTPTVECPLGPMSERGRARPAWSRWGVGGLGAATPATGEMARCSLVPGAGWPCRSTSGYLLCPGNEREPVLRAGVSAFAAPPPVCFSKWLS